MKITDLANELGVSRQYIDKLTQTMGMTVTSPHGIKWLTKPQIRKICERMGRADR